MAEHLPVLKNGVLEAFQGKKVTSFVDLTLGLGGHSELILEAHPEIHHFVGVDQDLEALKKAEERLQKFQEKAQFVHANFSEYSWERNFDAILMDIGVSSMQLDVSERGFSFMREGPLDMRMNREAHPSAYDVVNTFSENELGRIFETWGEEKKWRAAAKAIVERRRKKKIETTLELVETLKPVLGSGGKIHPCTQVFQALRIAVNREIEVLEETLPQAIDHLTPEGRLLVITFHSLEDRIVKNIFRDAAREKRVLLITKKPYAPTFQEVRENPRARSAKLRIVEKL